ADTPVLHTPDTSVTPVGTTEDHATAISGLSVSTTDGSTDAADHFSATLYVAHGTLALGTGLAATISGGDGHDLADAVVISGSLAEVNAALATVTYTPASEYEGADTLHFASTTTEDVGTSTASASTTVDLFVNGVADTPVLHTPDTSVTPVGTTEDHATAISGLSVSTTDGSTDAADHFSATLYVAHGTLALGTGLAVTISGGDGHDLADAVVISGSLAEVNAALATVTYTPASE